MGVWLDCRPDTSCGVTCASNNSQHDKWRCASAAPCGDVSSCRHDFTIFREFCYRSTMAAEVVIVCTGNSLVSAIHGDVGPTTDRKWITCTTCWTSPCRLFVGWIVVFAGSAHGHQLAITLTPASPPPQPTWVSMCLILSGLSEEVRI